MSNQVKFIGKGTDCQIRFTQSQVSTKHAKVTLTGYNTAILEDLNSTNGTFVDGLRIGKANITPQSRIVIANLPVSWEQLFPSAQPNPNPNPTISPEEQARVKADFQQLQVVYENYKIQQVKINTSVTRKRGIVTVVAALLPGILILGYNLLMSQELNPMIIVSGVGIGGVFGGAISSQITATEQIQQLTDDFNEQYACPKCRRSFGNRPWKVINNVGLCDFCKTKLV